MNPAWYDTFEFASFFLMAFMLLHTFIFYLRARLYGQHVSVLRKEAHKYQMLFESTSEGVFQCQTDGRLLNLNAAGEEILGLKSMQPHQSVADFIPHKPLLIEIKTELENNGQVRKTFIPARSICGKVLYLEISVHRQKFDDGDIYEGIFTDVTSRIVLENELARYRGHLESLVLQRTRDFEEANDQLIKHQVLLRRISRRQFEIQESERTRIAHELHDSAGQLLSALMMSLDLIAREDQALNPAAAMAWKEAVSITDIIMRTVHDLSLDLRPIQLDALGLHQAIQWLIKGFEKRSHVTVDYRTEGVKHRYSPYVESLSYRLVQEAVNNIEKHAKAGHVCVQISSVDMLRITITDDGCGFDAAYVMDPLYNCDKMGLLGMREQVEAAGGIFQLQTSEGAGTMIDFALPAERRRFD